MSRLFPKNLSEYRLPEGEHPICPACKKQADGLMARQIQADLGKAYVWCCPHCKTILGVTHRSGYIWT